MKLFFFFFQLRPIYFKPQPLTSLLCNVWKLQSSKQFQQYLCEFPDLISSCGGNGMFSLSNCIFFVLWLVLFVQSLRMALHLPNQRWDFHFQFLCLLMMAKIFVVNYPTLGLCPSLNILLLLRYKLTKKIN